MLLTKSRFPLLRFGATLVLGAALSACGATYLAQAASGQMAVMRAREPIEKVLEQPDTSASLREQLQRARRIRDFATAELGLPDNATYRSYADIGRPYVVWNVVAAPELSVAPRQWCFPVAGCVAYRGYFEEAAAREFAAKLSREGDDVVGGGVPAYSTLGRLADPLLSTVNHYSEIDLAALIFHELAHQVVYLAGDSGFNEAFATAVEQAGVARYAAAHLDAAGLAAWQARRRQRVELIARFTAARTDLAALYASAAPPDEQRRGKARRLALLAAELRTLEAQHGRPSGFGGWIEAGLNNAHLASVATYHERVPVFESLLREQCGEYLPCFYVEAARLAEAEKKKGRAVGGG